MSRQARLAPLVSAIAWLTLTFLPPTAHAAIPLRLADGVYAFVGAGGPLGSENRGRVANGGFVVGPTGVVVIDTGVSDAEGRERLAAIRRVTSKPVALVIITHADQEFLYGNTAFARLGTRFLCHERAADLMRQRCEHCLENLHRILGDEEMAGTRLIIPGETVSATTMITAGGRTLELVYPGWASSPGNLLVIDRKSRVLFAGGLLVNHRIPLLRDGKLDAWVRAIDAIGALDIALIVPGYGPPMPPADRNMTRDYLVALDRLVRKFYANMASLMETLDRADLPQFADWDDYESINRKNVQQRYLELEVEELGQ
ncbi:MAG: MBL fold metallo-hydrolase [Betaproteobacteria bacterium]|nr:MBL fold metallo-hydrolase [Betaproteobacteria bacterium]